MCLGMASLPLPAPALIPLSLPPALHTLVLGTRCCSDWLLPQAPLCLSDPCSPSNLVSVGSSLAPEPSVAAHCPAVMGLGPTTWSLGFGDSPSWRISFSPHTFYPLSTCTLKHVMERSRNGHVSPNLSPCTQQDDGGQTWKKCVRIKGSRDNWPRGGGRAVGGWEGCPPGCPLPR